MQCFARRFVTRNAELLLKDDAPADSLELLATRDLDTVLAWSD